MTKSEDFATADLSAKDPAPSPLQLHPSLWIHGAGLSGNTWREMTRPLDLALTPDLPGHGAAAASHLPRVEGFAGALLPDVPRDCVLIGHSLGGMVALELAIRARDRIAALILVEAVPTVRDSTLQRWSSQIAARIMTWVSPKTIAWLSGLGQAEATRQELRTQLAQHSKRSLSAALEAALHYDGRRHLGHISVPTLVVTGRENRATHRGAALMAKVIPGAEQITLPGGHMLHWDSPVELRGAIDDFLARRLP